MKRIMMIVIGAMIFVIPALAVSVCAKDSIVSVVLDPSIAGRSYTNNASTGVWKTVFPYGNVSGIHTCVSTASLQGDITKTSAGTPLESPGGETSGNYCWCKMTHPMSSLWVFNSTDCSNCLRDCGRYVAERGWLRAGLFGSVAAANAAF